jgi:hypothetical protein
MSLPHTVPSHYSALPHPTLPSQPLGVHNHVTSHPNLQDTYFDHAGRPEPLNNADFIPTSMSDPQGSVQVQNGNPSSETFINNQPIWGTSWPEPIHGTNFLPPSTSQQVQDFARTVTPPSHPIFNDHAPLHPDWQGTNLSLPHPIGSRPQGPANATFNSPAAHMHQYPPTTNSATSSTAHLQLGGGQLIPTAQDGTIWPGFLVPSAPPLTTPSFPLYVGPVDFSPQTPRPECSCPGFGD